MYIGQTAGKLSDIPADHPAIDAVYSVRAGKFRRYSGEGWRQVFDLRTQLLNLRDAWWTLVGIVQSYWLLRKLHPGIIFTRGGYVSVPVALGGRLNGVPYITHDSDSTPSLANRLIAGGAAAHAVALPAELYPYPKAKTLTVGVPVGREYRPVQSKLQHEYRQAIGLGHYTQLLFVTGGGNGADMLNQLVASHAAELLERFPHLAIAHIAGRTLEKQLIHTYDQLLDTDARKRVLVRGFVGDMYRYSGAADVIVARGGASTLAEFAIQGKVCIIIPAKQLAWQSHHARTLANRHAIVDLSEDEAMQDGRFVASVSRLLDDASQREQLAHNLAELGIPDAAERLAMVLLDKMQT